MIWNIVNTLGALALFIFGMKTLSEGIRLGSGLKLRRYLNSITKNRYSALFSGVLITSLLQSSSAFSVLLLGLVNNRLLSLKRAYLLIVGANVGTTSTLWLLVAGVSWKLDNLALPIIAVATLLLLTLEQKSKYWAQSLLGLGLIFLSLYFLSITVPDGAKIYTYLNPSQSIHWFSLLIFIGIGFLITAMLQSSSATTGLTLVVMDKAGLPLDLALMLIAGANIGTTFTAHLAAWVGGYQGKMVATFHTIFNLFGALLAYLCVLFFGNYLELQSVNSSDWVLPFYHTLLNVTLALIVIAFYKPIMLFFGRKIRPLFGVALNASHTLFSNPEVSILQSQKEVSRFAGVVNQTISTLGRLITEANDQKFDALKGRIYDLENEGDKIEQEVLENLKQLYKNQLDGASSKRIHKLMDVCYHLENVGDMAIKNAEIHVNRRDSDSYITPKLRSLLLELHDALTHSVRILNQNLSETKEYLRFDEAVAAEHRIDELYRDSNKALLRALDKEKIPVLSVLYYKELIQNYEIIGDHIFKANKSLSQL